MKFFYDLPVKLNIPSIPFKGIKPVNYKVQNQVIKDGFATNPIYDKFGTKAEIETIAKNNPKILAFFEKYNLPIKINMDELEKLKQGHLKDTRLISAQIYSSLPAELKNDKELPEDMRKRLEQEVQKVTDEFCKKIDDICVEKEKEIMEG